LTEIKIDTVYTASKYEQKVTEAPSSVSIITSDEIKKYGYRDLGEILQGVRGFHITNDRNYKYVGVRGFGLPSDYSNRVLLLVDGIRTNENVYDAPSVDNVFNIDIDLIDRIEVVRGPGSSLYGSNAFFAVINVFTKRGKDYGGVEVSGETGTWSRTKVRATYGNKYQNGLEVLLSASYLDSDGDSSLDYTDTYNDNPWICPGDDPDECYTLQDAWWYIDTPVARDQDVERYSDLFAELKFRDFTLQGSYHEHKKHVPTAPWETIFNEASTRTTEEQWWVDLKYEHSYENGLDVLARLTYQHYEYDGVYPFDDTGEDDEDLVIVTNKDDAEGEWLYGEVQLNKLLLEKHRVTTGANYQLNTKQEQNSVFEPHPRNWEAVDFHDDRDLDNWGVFIQDEFTITDTLILNAGVRYDHYETFGGATSPRAALIYNPFEKTTFKAVYGSAFRAPSVYELYYNDGGVSSKANSDLDEETIDTYELIYEQYIGKNLFGTIVGFYYEIDDLIRQDFDPTDGFLVFDNVGDANAKGVSFELDGKWDNGFKGSISYTFQETEDEETDRTLTNSPKHLIKANLIIPVIREKIFFSIEEQYTSKRKTLYREKQEDLPASLRNADYPSDRYAGSFAVTNITLFTRDLIKNLEASASVYNLFDKEYGDPGAGEHFQDTIEQDGRTVRLKLTYRF
jgi:iron complex outermembrane receptor protein